MAQSVVPKLTKSRSTPAESASILSLAKYESNSSLKKLRRKSLTRASLPSNLSKPGSETTDMKQAGCVHLQVSNHTRLEIYKLLALHCQRKESTGGWLPGHNLNKVLKVALPQVSLEGEHGGHEEERVRKHSSHLSWSPSIFSTKCRSNSDF